MNNPIKGMDVNPQKRISQARAKNSMLFVIAFFIIAVGAAYVGNMQMSLTFCVFGFFWSNSYSYYKKKSESFKE